MRSVMAALVMLGLCAGTARAADSACAVVEPLVYTDFELARVAKLIDETRHLDVLVIGTGSSILAGPGGTDIAYPARLQDAFASRFPGVTVKIVSLAKTKQTAAQMADQFDKILAEAKPALVIWQTGTFDAMSGVDPDGFHSTLDDGIETLKAGGADVILMNMQYSPRTELMIAATAYGQAMRMVALKREVPLFDRLAIMKHWSELGTFDLYAATKNLETAARVHNCIADLLVDLVAKGIKLSQAQPPVIQ